MPVLRRLLPALLALLASVLLAPAAASAADHPPLGAFTQLPGSGGCLGALGNADGCAEAPGAGDAQRPVATADGRHVYALVIRSGGAALIGLAADPLTGALRATEPAVCLTRGSHEGCTRTEELWRPTAFALAPDGRHLYLADDQSATGPSRVTTWTRDPATGALARVPGADGCITSGPEEPGCRRVAGLVVPGDVPSGPGELVVSPDGTSLYAVSSSISAESGVLTTLARDPASGRLTQPSATACLAQLTPLPAGCQAARALVGASEVEVSPDGRNVYVGGGTRSAGTIAVFARAAQGGLSQPAGAAGCVRDDTAPGDCAAGRAMGGAIVSGFPAPLAISPDGTTVYKAASDDGGGIAVFSRDATTGRLAQLSGRDGCVVEVSIGNDCRFANGVGRVWGLEVAPQGDAVLAFDYGGQGGGGHVAVLARAATGALTPLPAPWGCLGDVPQPTCVETPLLRSTAGGSFAPGGGAVYAGGWDSDAVGADPIVVLTREAAPLCEAGAARVVAGVPSELALVCREPNGQPMTRAVVGWPAHGTLRALGGDGRFAYTADAGYAGPDEIVFRAGDGAHESAPARIELTVSAPPPPPDPDPRRDGEPRPEPRRDDPGADPRRDGGGGERPVPSRLTVATRGTVRADARGRVRIALACAGTAPGGCGGSLTLRTARAVRPRPGVRARVLTVAPARRVRVANGSRATVTVTLSRQARTLLRTTPRLRVTVTAGSTRAALTVTAARPR